MLMPALHCIHINSRAVADLHPNQHVRQGFPDFHHAAASPGAFQVLLRLPYEAKLQVCGDSFAQGVPRL
jgi:hypothetical protein